MGSQDSKSESAPVDAKSRLETYQAGQSALGGASAEGAAYQVPTYERLGEGDYARVNAGLNAGTERQQGLALKANDQAMSDRGIYTSLNALRSNDSIREAYAPQFAANDATTMQMKAQDLAGVNTAAMENANRKYESSWRPADYKAGLWNGTGGVVSSGGTSGWSV